MVVMGSELMRQNMRFNLKLKQESGEDGDVVERCRLKNSYVRYNEVIGRGASKTVYKGFDEDEGVEVAWSKVMMPDHHLEKVYNSMKTLRHDNIVKSYVTWVDEDTKTLNMITEFFTSGSLREFRMKHKRVDTNVVKNWGTQILRGLAYLHSHEPPIIHGDLSCDSIFVNGCHREVKIGDMGLTSLKQRRPGNVDVKTGGRTLEFMAPELFEGKHDELVDIYSFGMCILELITCEYPYSECKDQSQLYERITSGIKPLCLSKVRDPQVKEFIQKCLVPVGQRLSAKELLNDPYLAEGSRVKERVHVSLEDFFPDNIVHLLRDNTMSFGRTSCVKNNDDGSPSCVSPILEVPSVNHEKNEKNEEEKCVTIGLRVVDIGGHKHTIEFVFNLDADNPHAMAKDMIEQVDILHEQDVATLAHRIIHQISKSVPTWKPPSFGKSSSNINGEIKSSDELGCKGMADNSLLLSHAAGESMVNSSIKSSSLEDQCKALKEAIDAIEAELHNYREAASKTTS